MFPSSISQFQYNLSVGAQLQNDGLRQLRRRLSTNRSLPRMSSAMGDVLLALPLGSSNENGDRVSAVCCSLRIPLSGDDMYPR